MSISEQDAWDLEQRVMMQIRDMAALMSISGVLELAQEVGVDWCYETLIEAVAEEPEEEARLRWLRSNPAKAKRVIAAAIGFHS